MDISKIYNDPIRYKRRKGIAGDPFKRIKESLFVVNGHVTLTEIPNRLEKVIVTGYSEELYETNDGELTTNTYKVDYPHGDVYFHGDLNSITLTFEYTGEGVDNYPDSRVYLTDDPEFNVARDKFYEIDISIYEQKNRVNTLISENPQPSEIVDIRIDRHGEVYEVAKDRIDALQKYIDDASVDNNGKRYNSLTDRISAIQDELELAHLTSDENELFDNINSRLVYDYTTLDSKIDEIHNRIGNVEDETRKNYEGFKEDGTFNVDYLSGVLKDEQLESAMKWNNYGTYIDQNGVYTGLVMADQMVSGILHAGNGNTEWNLNTGDLFMDQNNITFGSGASINFEDVGNRITYRKFDEVAGFSRSAGLGVGLAVGNKYPFAYLGANGSYNLDTLSPYFSGFMTMPTAYIAEGAANSVNGYRFQMRDQAVGWTKGLTFDFNGSPSIVPINGHQHNYSIGSQAYMFDKIHVRSMRVVGGFEIWNNAETGIGWQLSTIQESGRVKLRGKNMGTYNYDLGSEEDYNAFYYGYISHLRPSLNDSGSGIGSSNRPYVYGHIRHLTVHGNFWNNSLREYKENIHDLDLQTALDFVRYNKVMTYKYKDSNDTSVGLIRDDLIIKDESLVANDTAISPTNVIYMNQKVNQYNLKKVEELERRIKRLEKENEKLRAQ